MVNYANLFVLAAKTAVSSADNPTCDQAMKGPFAEECWRVAEVEVGTLEKIRAQDIIEPIEGMNVLPEIWVFKCKQYPDGKVKSSRQDFVQEVTNKRKELISPRRMHQLHNGQL